LRSSRRVATGEQDQGDQSRGQETRPRGATGHATWPRDNSEFIRELTSSTMDQQTAFNQEVVRLQQEVNAYEVEVKEAKEGEDLMLGKETKVRRIADAAAIKAQRAVEKTVAAVQITQAAREKWLGATKRLQQLKQEYLRMCEHQIEEKLKNMNMN
jgi:mevalonate kinase